MHRLLVFTSLVWLVLPLSAAEPAPPASTNSPAGHWEGAINLPGTDLGVRVDLEPAGNGWKGTIDIPVQTLRGFALGDVTVSNRTVAFAMPGIPGDPRFRGSLAADGQSLQGDFTQDLGKFPFKLERKTPVPERGATPARGIPGTGFAGFWQGTLKPAPAIELRLLLELTNAPGGTLTGAVVSLDQGEARIPITSVTATNSQLRFETRSVGGSYRGDLAADTTEISGDWEQGGRRTSLQFKRVARAPNLRRPQEPTKPYPYREEPVSIAADRANLAGTLTLPPGAGPHPAVVLITGSGPEDRDEAILGHRPFLVLADHLTRRGFAVLRCDDRGVGASTGNFAEATEDDFVADTLAQIDHLRGRPEIDPQRIGLIGHSEGGVIAPRVAVKSTHVAFIVQLAGVGVPMDELLVRQGRDIAAVMGVGPEGLKENEELQRALFQVLKTEPDRAQAETALRRLLAERLARFTPEQRQAAGLSADALEGQLRTILTPWFRQIIAYDPRPTLRAVTCPVLALNGEKDLQVAADANLPAIRDALAAGGNNRVKTITLPGLNHLFQRCRTGAVNEYAEIDETINPAALAAISDWLAEVSRH